ncbi:hypothetical protein PYW07_000021 [Mythimna separata]|uniref:Peptidase S1 domain-containing protein n=1 Tax=Mythimna separata TaxID=271217 RepID=A0AAD8E1H3_MYTSE|nr:hypothetical protein PYW07_000021 [Mythimna separata]
MILRSSLLAAAVLTLQLPSGRSASTAAAAGANDVYEGSNEDNDSKYCFVVAVINKELNVNYGRCTGILISPNWVLTAAKCLDINAQVQFDEMDLPLSETNSIRRVLQLERPPAGPGTGPDLGFIYVKDIPRKEYGKLSAVDYKAIAGRGSVVLFAGFEPVKKNGTERPVGLVQVGEGVASSCKTDEEHKTMSMRVPSLCVAPKCWERPQDGADDPGSPLFLRGKLVGVHMGGVRPGGMRAYTPISPYLAWIQQVVTKPEVFRARGSWYHYSDMIL